MTELVYDEVTGGNTQGLALKRWFSETLTSTPSTTSHLRTATLPFFYIFVFVNLPIIFATLLKITGSPQRFSIQIVTATIS